MRASHHVACVHRVAYQHTLYDACSEFFGCVRETNKLFTQPDPAQNLRFTHMAELDLAAEISMCAPWTLHLAHAMKTVTRTRLYFELERVFTPRNTVLSKHRERRDPYLGRASW